MANSLEGEKMVSRLLLVLVLAPLTLSGALAQNWPTRQITTVVPQSPGSALDIVTRAVMEQLSSRLGQTIIVENRVGAGNTIAMATVARAEPEGYKNVAQFVADAKSKKGAMNYSSGGVGSITHLAMEAFRLAAGFEAVHVP